uniref:ATP synthase subunit a n=1 Tax=Diolcogaster sp. SNS-2016 TaxID=1911508 RepID=A0A6F8AHI6_9HYME|nr:ATP synthase FO subunit 6 [Diolcogaster sp. SNS-2016]
MMLNLFTIFDPSTKFFSLNWMSTMLILMFFPQMFWLMNSRMILIFNLIFNYLYNEFKMILMFKFNLNNLIFIINLFIFLMFNNFMGLFPYIFTSSSHIVFSLWISISLWLSFMIFGWLNNFNQMLIHLVPMGTPFILMFFMIMIELLSNIIRPLTLCIRLMANMIAGHLLLTLLGNFIEKFLFIYILNLLIQLMLLFLEMMVSMIQSYVFVILMTLYLKETN